jgi:hypothetical protein
MNMNNNTIFGISEMDVGGLTVIDEGVLEVGSGGEAVFADVDVFIDRIISEFGFDINIDTEDDGANYCFRMDSDSILDYFNDTLGSGNGAWTFKKPVIIELASLPTSPGVAGQLWRDASGFVKVSP